MTDLVGKIKDFYKPEFKFYATYTLLSKGQRVSVSTRGDNEMILSFGYPAKNREDAIKNGAYVTTGKELFKLIFPEKWEEVKAKIEPDNRTKGYLDGIKSNIGYLKTNASHDEEEIQTVNSHQIWINASDVEVGKNEEGVWVAQYSVRTAIDDYIIVRYYYSKKPDVKSIMTTKTLEDIDDHFYRVGWDKSVFKCWECGLESHWLDCPGDLEEKWENFKEQYCGC